MKITYKSGHVNQYIQQAKVPQTEENAAIAQLLRHFNTHPSVGITPSRAAEILKLAEQGDLIAQCDLAANMEEKDAHLQSEISKRRRAVLERDWRIVPPRNATKEEIRDTDMLSEIVEDFVWLDDAIFDATDAILKGFSAQEFLGYEEVDGLMLPCGIEFRDPAMFQVSRENRNELRLRSSDDINGAELNPFGWIVHNAKSRSGYLGTTGLVRTLIFPFIFKNYSVRDLAEFLEIYGLPIRLGQYPSGATDKEKSSLLQAVMSIGHNAGGIIPAGMKIDFQGAAEGSSDPFLAMINWAEMSMSKAILGGTLTSQADGATSTNALGNVHDGVRMEVMRSDAKQLAATLTRDLILPIYAMNCDSYSSTRRTPRFEFDFNEAEDITVYASALPALAGAGMKIPLSWVHDKLQIPLADKDEPILQAPVAAPAFLSAQLPRQQESGFAALSVRQSTAQDALSAMPAAVSGQQWQSVMSPIIQPVIDIIQAEGLEAAKLKVSELYAGMDDAELADILHRAAFVADLWGRNDATSN